MSICNFVQKLIEIDQTPFKMIDFVNFFELKKILVVRQEFFVEIVDLSGSLKQMVYQSVGWVVALILNYDAIQEKKARFACN